MPDTILLSLKYYIYCITSHYSLDLFGIRYIYRIPRTSCHLKYITLEFRQYIFYLKMNVQNTEDHLF